MRARAHAQYDEMEQIVWTSRCNPRNMARPAALTLLLAFLLAGPQEDAPGAHHRHLDRPVVERHPHERLDPVRPLPSAFPRAARARALTRSSSSAAERRRATSTSATPSSSLCVPLTCAACADLALTRSPSLCADDPPRVRDARDPPHAPVHAPHRRPRQRPDVVGPLVQERASSSPSLSGSRRTTRADLAPLALAQIVPIGALFSASLIFSNLAYLTLSVSFIQMCVAPPFSPSARARLPPRATR